MYKNKLFQSSRTKNELFKVQEWKTKLMYNLGMKTIFWPIFIYIFCLTKKGVRWFSQKKKKKGVRLGGHDSNSLKLGQ